MGRLRYITRDDVRDIVDSLARGPSGSAAAFQLAGPQGAELLDSALAQPRWPHHRTLQEKAAALHYSLTKNHPFVDGNKRVAVTAMEWFLIRNGAVLVASNDEIVQFALDVARGAMTREQSRTWVRHRTLRVGWSAEQQQRWRARLPEEHARGVDAALSGSDGVRLALIALVLLIPSLDELVARIREAVPDRAGQRPGDLPPWRWPAPE